MVLDVNAVKLVRSGLLFENDSTGLNVVKCMPRLSEPGI